jgi:hypothetical protein
VEHAVEFTALETIQFTIIGAIIAGIAVRVFLSNKFISKKECELRLTNCRTEGSHFTQKIDDLRQELKDYQAGNKRRLDALFRMVRGLIVQSNLSKEKQEQILNQQIPSGEGQ